MKVSSSKENYLKAIFHLQEEDGVVTTNDLARELDTRAGLDNRHAEETEDAETAVIRKISGFQAEP